MTASALLLVDVQNDFCPGGALAVPGGDAVIPPLNRLCAAFAARGLPVVASRDWHPVATRHFVTHGGPWPVHCVQKTAGAEFPPALALPPGTLVVVKGDDPDRDDYSALAAHDGDGTPLPYLLRALAIRHLVVGGLATDYCVRATVLAARAAGFAVTVATDGIAGVELTPGDSDRACAEMRAAGARFAPADEIVAELTR